MTASLFFPQASHFTTYLLEHVQKSKFGEKVTYIVHLKAFWVF